MVFVHRWCHVCDKVTKWVVQPVGTFWEKYTCKGCGTSHNKKTK